MLKRETYLTVVGVVFAVIAVVHLLRTLYSWPAQIGTFVVPLWLSWVALVVAAYLSYSAFSFNK